MPTLFVTVQGLYLKKNRHYNLFIHYTYTFMMYVSGVSRRVVIKILLSKMTSENVILDNAGMLVRYEYVYRYIVTFHQQVH